MDLAPNKVPSLPVTLRAKIDTLLEVLGNPESEFCSFEELEEKTRLDEGLSDEKKFKAVLRIACKYTINTKNQFWVAKLYGGGTEASFLAEMIIAYFNQNCHTYSSSPLFTYAEEEILKKVIGYVGFDAEEAGGLFLPGGSYATLNAMICARYSKYPNCKRSGLNHPIQVITSINSHYSIEKSANMMGIGVDNVIKIDFDKTTSTELDEILTKNKVFLINSTAGTTSEGTMESIEKFSEVLRKHEVWHHIDACVGGLALFSEKYRYMTKLFKEADSITVDAHKCLNINQQCTMLLMKKGRLLGENSSVVAPYLFHEDDKYDISHRSLQCGRRADGFKLWFCDKIDDLDAQATLIYDRTTQFKKIVASDERFQQVLEDSPTHICFKINNAFKVNLHKITETLRRENIFVEYHNDYFRLVVVNACIIEKDFKEILNRLFEVYENLSA